jgi:hypothetical protein
MLIKLRQRNGTTAFVNSKYVIMARELTKGGWVLTLDGTELVSVPPVFPGSAHTSTVVNLSVDLDDAGAAPLITVLDAFTNRGGGP